MENKDQAKFRIGLDARTLQVKGGAKTYVQNLLDNFDDSFKLILFGVGNFRDFECVPEKLNQRNPFWRLYWELIKLNLLIKKNKIDLFHGAKGVVPPFSSVKKVVTVNDVLFFKFPQYSTWIDRIYITWFWPFYIRRADHLIAISQATKIDIVEFLKIDPVKISVIYGAYDQNLFQPKIKEECYQRVSAFLQNQAMPIADLKNKKIILNVNTVQPRKNINNIIKAFDLIAEKEANTILIISGKKGWKSQNIYQQAALSKFKDRIYFLGYTSDEIVADLYNLAAVFVYPSFYEGFGLPILEAQACGCPVITSNVSSMPEVAGEDGILIDPNSVEAIALELSQILNDKNRAEKIKNAGFKNIARFSWAKCAQETEAVYQSCLKN